VCPSKYFKNDDGSVCSPCDEGCEACETLSNNCSACSTSYLLSADDTYKCNQCIEGCENCDALDTCSLCLDTGWYLEGSICTQACSSSTAPGHHTKTNAPLCLPCDTGCLTCNDNITDCQSCTTGYYLKNVNECHACPDEN
jgi:hypothetical protein